MALLPIFYFIFRSLAEKAIRRFYDFKKPIL